MKSKLTIAILSMASLVFLFAVGSAFAMTDSDIRLAATRIDGFVAPSFHDPVLIPDADIAAAREQFDDARGGFDKPHVVAAHIDIEHADGARWVRAPAMATDGAVWRLAIRAEGAYFLRPHFTDTISSPAFIAGADGTFERIKPPRAESPDGFWGAAVIGDELVVEVEGVPDTPPAAGIDRISYGFEDVFAINKEQRCHLDVNCYDDWAEVESGIGIMLFEYWGMTSMCTGTLIEDEHQTGRPWFLTAHHCIGNQNEASTLVVYWHYETEVCNGTVPNMTTLAHSDGADYIAGTTASDFTLLSLRTDPPADVAHVPLSIDAVATGDPITVIHHPDGSWKRITFGNEVRVLGKFVYVKYTEGSTEGGSSGSPLFNANKEIIGQLQGGSAACNRMNGEDYFGMIKSSWDLGLSEYMESTVTPTTTSTTTTTQPPWFDDDANDDDASDDDADDDADDDESDDDAALDVSSDDDDDDSGGCGC